MSAALQVWCNVWSMHHDERYFSRPWEFLPQRYLDDQGNPLPADHPNKVRCVFPFAAVHPWALSLRRLGFVWDLPLDVFPWMQNTAVQCGEARLPRRGPRPQPHLHLPRHLHAEVHLPSCGRRRRSQTRPSRLQSRPHHPPCRLQDLRGAESLDPSSLTHSRQEFCSRDFSKTKMYGPAPTIYLKDGPWTRTKSIPNPFFRVFAT